MPKRLTGINPLAYRGVEAVQPPNIVESSGATVRQPTTSDYYEFNEGDIWMVKRDPAAAIPNELWYLARKTGTALGVEAHWRQLYPQAGGGGGGNLRSDDALISVPDLITGAINVYGGNAYVPGSDIRLGDPNYVNIYTVQFPDVNTLEVVLKRSINQPNTNATATEGMYSLEGLNFMHNYGTNNTFLGHSSGNLGLDPVVASLNTGIGKNALHALQNGSRNTAIGASCMLQTDDGVYNVGIGYNTGSACAGADSDLILISNVGVNGESNAIRIGTMGVGDGQQDACYVAGIWNGVAIPGKDTGLVLVDEDGKLYVDDLEPNSCVFTDATGNPIAVKGPVGTVLTGHGIAPGDPSPEFLPVESAGGTVTISTNPITGAINLEAAGVAGLVTLTSDLGVVLPLLGNINVIGGELINTDNLVANTVTVNLDRGADGTVVAGTGAGSAAIYKTLFSPDGSIVFDFVTDPTAIHMVAPGGGGGGVTNLTADSGVPALPVGGAIQIAGGLNIRTVGSNPPGVITVHVTDDVDLAGHLYATTDIKTSTGNLVSTAGNLILPNTDGAGTMGAIRFGAGLGTRWIHNYGTNNVFVGPLAGNNSLTVADAVGNIGIGRESLKSVTTGSYNTGCGYASNYLLTTGDYNSAFGRYALRNISTGSYNVALGHNAGSAYTGAEHGNICISNIGVLNDAHQLRLGTHGTGDQQQSDCYIAGIRDSAAGTSPEMVVIGTVASGYKVWSEPIPSGISTFTTNSGNATPSAGVIKVLGTDNINTIGSGNTVTVRLNHSISQPTASADGSDGLYSLGGYDFMHNYPGVNTFLGVAAGNRTCLGSQLNVGIGTNALLHLTSGTNNVCTGYKAGFEITTGINNTAYGHLALTNSSATAQGNTAIGRSSLSNIVGTFNTAIGYASGANSIGGNSNLYLGSPGPVPGGAESNTIRIGSQGTAPTQQNRAYCAGIYGVNIGQSLPVYIKSDGQLGTTGGSIIFGFRQTTTIPSATGDGTVYVFGTSSGLTIDYDDGATLSGGTGTPIIFTAPATGRYSFVASVTVSVPASPPVPRPVSVDPLYLVTSNLSYAFTSFIPASTTIVQYVSEIVTATVDLDLGDTVRWACAVGTGATAKNIGIINFLSPTIPVVGVTNCYATFFTGYRIS